jgi:hypothetical protein
MDIYVSSLSGIQLASLVLGEARNSHFQMHRSSLLLANESDFRPDSDLADATMLVVEMIDAGNVEVRGMSCALTVPLSNGRDGRVIQYGDSTAEAISRCYLAWKHGDTIKA